jgi:hypothetical protein
VNVGTYLLLTVPIVGGSLYVYDSLKPEPAPVVLEAAPAVTRPEPRAETPAPLLQGDPSAQLERLVREEVRRHLAGQPASGATTGVLPSGGSDAGLPAGAPSLLGTDPEVVEGESATFDEKTMRVFRAYMAEAQRLREEEQRVSRINRTLDNIGVSITDGQRNTVVAATLKLWTDALKLGTRFPGVENAEARKKASQELRETYAKTVNDAVPAAEAEKIISELGSRPGWGDGVPGATMPNRGLGGRGNRQPGEGP